MTENAANIIRKTLPDFRPRLAFILGSGLGPLADAVNVSATFDYASLPGFPKPGVGGHAGQLVFGHIGRTPVAVLKGRAHYYERANAAEMAVPVATLAELGCEILCVTNAAGSLDANIPPGSAMIIRDHLNMVNASPLVGIESDRRFVPMGGAYDLALRQQLQQAAEQELGRRLPEGVYAWMAGPQFETPAEIRMLSLLGATAVGMSTVPEVILARYHGLRVLGVSVITNLAEGMSDTPLSHDQTLEYAKKGADALIRLLARFASEMSA
ncbi:purine-nucleoside phosphorylase [Hahella sp. SMD15-11]|uniref:Purine nucleoside phosphorylase n=1 Tax=Thermohahella caldifontis TaxID=3142973 RepID=A0AB39UYZ6_9GAMM